MGANLGVPHETCSESKAGLLAFFKSGLRGILNGLEKASENWVDLSFPRDRIIGILCGSTLIPSARDVTVTRIRNLSRRA